MFRGSVQGRTLVACSVLFLAATVPRIGAGLFVVRPTTTYMDEKEYIWWSESMARGAFHWFDRIKPPLYGGFLLTVSAVLGKGVVPIRIAQSVLAGVAAILVFFIGARLFGERTGMIAAGVFAFYPPAVYLTALVYPQAILTLFLAAAVLMALHSAARLTLTQGITVGLLLGAAVLCVEMAISLVPAMLLWLFLRRNGHTLRVKVKFAGALLLGLSLTFAPWVYRNHQMTGRLMPLLDYAARCFWSVHLPGTDVKMLKHDDPSRFGPEYTQQRQRVVRQTRDLTPDDQRRALMREAWMSVRRDGWRFAYLTAGKFVYFFWPYPEPLTKSRFTTPGYKALAAACYLPLLILALYGIVLAWRHRPDGRLLTLVVVLYAFGYSVVHVSYRYRLPTDPLMWIFSAYGMTSLVGALRWPGQPHRGEARRIGPGASGGGSAP